jgi:hypothetical protein
MYSFSLSGKPVIRSPDQLRDVAPELGAARLREKHPCFRSFLSSIRRWSKPKIAEKIIDAVNTVVGLISSPVNNLLIS